MGLELARATAMTGGPWDPGMLDLALGPIHRLVRHLKDHSKPVSFVLLS